MRDCRYQLLPTRASGVYTVANRLWYACAHILHQSVSQVQQRDQSAIILREHVRRRPFGGGFEMQIKHVTLCVAMREIPATLTKRARRKPEKVAKKGKEKSPSSYRISSLRTLLEDTSLCSASS